MDFLQRNKLIFIIIGVVIIFAGITYFTTYKIKFSVEDSENGGVAVADPTTKKNEFTVEAKEHFKKGRAFLKDKKLDEALKEFEKSAKISPDIPLIHFWIGKIYFFKMEPERAIAKFKKVLEMEPENHHALSMIGKILASNRDKLDDAVIYLNKAIKISPDYAEAHFDLGRIFALKGDIKRSLAEFALIFSTEPRYAAYHFELGRIFESVKDVNNAKREYNRAFQLNPRMSIAKEALDKLKETP